MGYLYFFYLLTYKHIIHRFHHLDCVVGECTRFRNVLATLECSSCNVHGSLSGVDCFNSDHVLLAYAIETMLPVRHLY